MVNELRTLRLCAATAVILFVGSLSIQSWAVTNEYVPATGGSWNTAGNWSLGHTPVQYEDVKIEVSGNAHKGVTYGVAGSGEYFDVVTIDGGGSYYAAIWHLSHALDAYEMRIGQDGEAYHWMEGSAYLSVTDNLYVGYQDPGPGFFYLATDTPFGGSGVVVGDLLYVGYSGPGQFDHVAGGVEAHQLYVGQNDSGKYNLSGSLTGSILALSSNMVIGNADDGEFEQTGGTVNSSGGGTFLGVNSGGVGTYLMKGGEANLNYLTMALNGVGYFTQTGGTVHIDNNINIGGSGTNTLQSWYKISEADGAAELNVGGYLNVGEHTYGKYEQNGGTVDVTGNLEIWKGTTTTSSSYVYLGLNAGTLDVGGEVINHTGYYDQDGGILTTSDFTNNSAQGLNLDNNADLRARNLTHTQGTFYMWRNAILRGPLAIPPAVFWVCNFTNDSTFQMGSAGFDGGLFQGTLTNNGAFNYYQGDFSVSVLINNGTFNCNAPFACARFVQNAGSFTVSSANPITASGAGQVNAIENNSSLYIPSGATVHLGAGKPLVNNDNLFAGGTIDGDLENNDYLLPSTSSNIGLLNVLGSFTQSSTGTLRIRLDGDSIGDYDRVLVSDAADFSGKLDVRLLTGYTPGVGDSYVVMRYASRSGAFNPIYWPSLPDPDWYWQVEYLGTALRLSVLLEGDCDGDSVLDYDDFINLCGCLHGPDHGLNFGCSCNDLDNDGDVTVLDAAEFQVRYPG